MFVLIVNHHGSTQEYPLCEGRTVVGRGQNCDVVINDESISRQHARLVVRADVVELSDLQSRNGTYVAGEAVRETTLRGGERLSFGDVEASIAERPDAPAATGAAGAIVGEHTLFRQLGDSSPPTAAVRIVEAPRLINLLSEVARTLVATVPVQDILNRVIDLLLAHVPAERACLALAAPGTQALTSQIVRRADGKPAQEVAISRTVRDMTLSQRVAVLTSDVHQDPRFDGSQSVLLSDVRSLICGSLYAGEELIGLLYVDNPVTRQFSEADLELFSAIANYAAVAVTQGRLAERLREESERRERLQRYHSPAVVERIMAQRGDGSDVLGAQDRDISVLFADLVGFTTLSETLPPSEVASVLNRFFSEMTDAIFAEDGTVDKFIGDAILGVFGAPVEQHDHPRRAVRAAQAMRRAVGRLNAAGGRPLRVRYAINSGVAIAGDVGSARRREYTVLGDVVNTASRLEALAEPDQIIVSRATYDRIAPPIAATSLGEVAIRGRAAKVEILSIDPD